MFSPTFGAKYEILRVLGEGGMGRVYLGREVALSRLVAIKMLIAVPCEDRVAFARFEEEARICAQLKHRNVVRLYASGLEDDKPYLVFEFVEGLDLKHELSAHGRLPPAKAVALACGVLAGLSAAHDVGIVHRDVKPANIVLLAKTGEPMLMDFGVARAKEGRRVNTAAGVILGTVGYMAPELFMGDPATPASDVFSLGCVLYECLTGRHPFAGDTDLAVIQRQLAGPPPEPHTVVAEVPPAVSQIAMRALERLPSKRYADARAMSAALEEATGQAGWSSVAVPIAASPPAPSSSSRPRRSSPTRALSGRREVPTGPSSPTVALSQGQRPRSRRALAVLGAALGLAAGVWAYRAALADPVTGLAITASDDGTLEVRWSTRREGRGAVRCTGSGLTQSATEGAPGTAHHVVLTGLEPGARVTLAVGRESGETGATREVALPAADQPRIEQPSGAAPAVLLPPAAAGAPGPLDPVLTAPGLPVVRGVARADGALAFPLPAGALALLAGAQLTLQRAPGVHEVLHVRPSAAAVARLRSGLAALDVAALVKAAVKDPQFADSLDLEFGGATITPDKPFIASHRTHRMSQPLRSGRIRAQVEQMLREHGVLDALERFRPLARAYFTDPAVPLETRRALAEALGKLVVLDLLVATQHDPDAPHFRDLTAGWIDQRFALEPRARPPAPAPPEVQLLDRPDAWVPADYHDHLAFSLWLSVHNEIQRVFALSLDLGALFRQLVHAPRRYPFPAALRWRPDSRLTLRALVTYMGAGYYYRVKIRGKAGGDLVLTLGHPGTADWYPGMDGRAENRKAPDQAGDGGQGGWISWGRIETSFPASALPDAPETVEVENLHLPGVDITELNPSLMRVTFLRDLTAGWIDQRFTLEPRARPPAPGSPEVQLLDRPEAWVPADYHDHLAFSLWLSVHNEIQRVFALSLDLSALFRQLVHVPRRYPFPAALRWRADSRLTLRALVTYMGAGYYYRVKIRGKAGGDLVLTLGHPGTADWYPGMDGRAENRKAPDQVGDGGQGGWISWGCIETSFPASALPEAPETVEVENLHLPGVDITELNPSLMRVTFLRDLTLEVD